MDKKDNNSANEEKKKFSTANQYLAAVICSFLATMYGQTVGWSSAAIPQLEKGDPTLPSGEEGIDSVLSGWIGGAFCLGALVTSPVHGLLADARGRKFAGFVVAGCFVIHWILVSFGGSMPLLIIGRGFGGAGGGGSITIASMYINEVSEQRIRGRLGGFLALFYVIGIFSAFIIGAYISFYMNCNIYLLISVLYLAVWWKMPETPAYLLLRGDNEKVVKSFMWLRKCSEVEANAALNDLKVQQAGAAKTATIREFFTHAASRRGIILASTIVSIQTFSGIFAIHSYASTIFSRAGGILDPSTSTIVYGGLMCAGATIPPLLVDRFGRNVLLAWSSALMSIGMTVLSLYFWGVSSKFLELKIGSEKTAFDVAVEFLPIVALSFTVLIYYIGLGSVTYITSVELFLDEMRGIAGAIVSAVIWFTSFLLLLFFGPAVETIGDHFVFLFFGAVCLSGMIFTLVCLPETKGKSQQEIAAILSSK